MAYTRVWVPELGAWKIIGEDTGEYAEIYKDYPGTTQINIPASTGQIIISQPGEEGMVIGEIPIAGQIPDLELPYVITPYVPAAEIPSVWTPTPAPAYVPTPFIPTPSVTPTPTPPWEPDPRVGAGFMGFGVVTLLALAIFALGRRK